MFLEGRGEGGRGGEVGGLDGAEEVRPACGMPGRYDGHRARFEHAVDFGGGGGGGVHHEDGEVCDGGVEGGGGEGEAFAGHEFCFDVSV